MRVVRVNVRAWKSEKMAYGNRATAANIIQSGHGAWLCQSLQAMGFEVHQKNASSRYCTF